MHRNVRFDLLCVLAALAIFAGWEVAIHHKVHAQNATVNGVPNQVISMTTYGCYDGSGNLHQCKQALLSTTSSGSTGAWSITPPSLGCSTLVSVQPQPVSTGSGTSGATFTTIYPAPSLTSVAGYVDGFQTILGLNILPIITSTNAQTVYVTFVCY